MPSKGERMPLEIRDFRATDEDVLASASGRFLFFNLDLDDF